MDLTKFRQDSESYGVEIVRLDEVIRQGNLTIQQATSNRLANQGAKAAVDRLIEHFSGMTDAPLATPLQPLEPSAEPVVASEKPKTPRKYTRKSVASTPEPTPAAS